MFTNKTPQKQENYQPGRVEIELFRLHATDRVRVSNLWTKTEIPNKVLTQEFSNIVNY